MNLVSTMIYVCTVYFGLSLMHMMRFMWRNYLNLIIGVDIGDVVAGNAFAGGLWLCSHLLFAGLVLLLVSVPAVKNRDITDAALNGLLFGGLAGFGLAVLASIAGNIGSALEFLEALTLLSLTSLIVSLTGYLGGMLSHRSVLEALSGRKNEPVLANDNDKAEISEGAVYIESVHAFDSQFARMFDNTRTTLPGDGSLRHGDRNSANDIAV